MKLRLGMVAAALGLIGVAHAADVGTVTSVGGEKGAVLVVRGNQTYTLSAKDLLFEGDQVFTRANGTAEIKYFKCSTTLNGASYLVLSEDCTKVPVSLKASDTINGIKIGEASAGTIGATPALLTALGVTGLAAGTGGNSSSP